MIESVCWLLLIYLYLHTWFCLLNYPCLHVFFCNSEDHFEPTIQALYNRPHPQLYIYSLIHIFLYMYLCWHFVRVQNFSLCFYLTIAFWICKVQYPFLSWVPLHSLVRTTSSKFVHCQLIFFPLQADIFETVQGNIMR